MNKYFRAISHNYIFLAISTLAFLILTPIAIRVMGEEMYGLWSMLNAILLFSGIGVLGMGTVVNKFASEGGEQALQINSILSAATIILLPMSGLVALILFLGRGWIASQFGLAPGYQQQFSVAMIFTALSIFPQFLGRIPHGYLLSQLKNKLARAVELGINISMLTGAVIIAYIAQNLIWMALWAFIVQTIGMATLFAIVLSEINFQWKIEVPVFRRLLSFSGFSFLESLAVSLFQQFDRILVGFLLGPAAAGVYSVGTSVALRLSIVAGQATEVMLPYASRKYSDNEHVGLYSTFRKMSKIIALLIGMFAALLILWMDKLLSLWISPEYSIKYTKIFCVFILAYFLISLSRVGHQTLTGMGKARFTSLMYLFTSILMLAGVYLLTKRNGLMGAAMANLIMVLLLSFNLFVYSKFSKLNLFNDFVKDNCLPIVMLFIAYLMTLQPIHSSISVRIYASLAYIMLIAIFLIRIEVVHTLVLQLKGRLLKSLQK
jgi:O-antigen/teichoic acid export membrane protein